MAGVAIEIKDQGLERLEARLNTYAAEYRTSLLEAVSAEIETGRRKETKRRIEKGGPGPQGFSFERFAAFGEGDLDDAIEALVDGDFFLRSTEFGMELVHGAIRPFGGAEVGSGQGGR